ncbi:MAG: XdhC family protein [Marmoricola sp.]|nr:XdhC family protein [Marmoricola sp.]
MKVLVVGAGPVCTALVPLTEAVGWTPVVATSLDEFVPHVADADAVVVLAHEGDVDGPAIKAALAAGTAYVGAMGSRRTQARRREWMLANGVTETGLEALHAPIGLDIGADAPGEIAVAILAEIIAVRRNAVERAASIAGREGPIHPGLAPGEASCPGG